MAETELSNAVVACQFFLKRLQNDVDCARSWIFPGKEKDPFNLLESIQNVIEEAEYNLRLAETPSLDKADRKSYLEIPQDLSGNAYEFFEFITNAGESRLPHEVIPAFRRWVKKFQISAPVLFNTEHMPNYENKPLQKEYRNRYGRLQKLEVKVLRLPAYAMGQLPHFAVIGHELGHDINNGDIVHHEEVVRYQYPRNTHRPQRANEFREVLPEEDYNHLITNVKSTVNQVVNNGFSGEVPADTDIEERIKNTLLHWIDEFKADAVAHALVGPAFFFAATGFFQLTNIGFDASPTHPPTDIRRRLLFEAIQEEDCNSLSFYDVLNKSNIQVAEDIVSPTVPECHGRENLLRNAPFNELLNKLGILETAVVVELADYAAEIGRRVRNNVKIYMEEFFREEIYKPAHLDSDSKYFLDTIESGVAPIEQNGEPISLPAILNLGWLQMLRETSRTDGKEVGDKATAIVKANELLLKGLELAEAKRMWEKTTHYERTA